MIRFSAALMSAACLCLAACGERPASDANSADDFAARINGGEKASPAPVVKATNAPTVAQPLPGAVEGAYVPGTLTDPQSSTCGANLMGGFIGQQADDATRTAVMEAASGNAQSVRFVLPGSTTVNPDPANPRLSIMIDNLNVIRDARCG